MWNTNHTKLNNIFNISWTLFPIPGTANSLRVAKECPYYNDDYTVAKFTKEGVYGPFNEFYIYNQGNVINVLEQIISVFYVINNN